MHRGDLEEEYFICDSGLPFFFLTDFSDRGLCCCAFFLWDSFMNCLNFYVFYVFHYYLCVYCCTLMFYSLFDMHLYEMVYVLITQHRCLYFLLNIKNLTCAYNLGVMIE